MDKKNQELPFEVSERKITLATRLSDYFFARKVRRNVKNNRTPEMKKYLSERKNPVAVRLTNPDSVKARPVSLEKKIEAHLRDGKSITVLECMELFRSSELRHEIAAIRKRMEVKDKWETTPTQKRVKRYYAASNA